MRYHLTKSLYTCLFVTSVAMVCVILLGQGGQNEKLIFSGRIVNSDGVPVADAEILYVVVLDRFARNPNSPESVGHTAVDGTFQFEIPQSEPEKWDQVGIIATHPDYALGWQNLSPQSTADIELQLGTPNPISGKIMNEMGEPIQNAAVRAYYTLRARHYLWLEDIPINPANADANGNFVLHPLLQGTTVIITIQAQGYAKEGHERVAVGSEGLEFRLKREGRIEGRLSYAETGAPVEGAMVVCHGIHPANGMGETTTDENGDYILKNLPAGRYNLFFDEGPEGWTAVAKEFVEVVKGQTTSNIDLTLVRGGFLTGRVMNRDTKKPIANHRISFTDTGAKSEVLFHRKYETHTDENGTYRFYVPPGRMRLYTQVPRNYLGSGQMIDKYVDVVEGETVVTGFQFSRGEELEVQVLTEDGKPVSGAFISYVKHFGQIGRTDKQGQFIIGGLKVGQELTVTAVHTRLGLRGTKSTKVPQAGSVEIWMQQHGWVKVSGRVVNDEGEPIPSADITLKHHLPSSSMSTFSQIAAITDGDGRFKDVELIVGDVYEISAGAEGYQRAKTARFIATSEMSEIETLILPDAGRFFIEGRLTDTSGEPVYGAYIYTDMYQLAQSWNTHTDENGDYRLDTLSVEVISNLRINHPKYAHHIFKGLKTNQRHDLVLVKADGYLAGKVVDADGKPIARARVKIHPEEDPATGYQYAEDWTNVHGEFELKHIKGTMVSLHVTPPGAAHYPTDDDDYQSFEVAVNQRNLTLRLDELRLRE